MCFVYFFLGGLMQVEDRISWNSRSSRLAQRAGSGGKATNPQCELARRVGLDTEDAAWMCQGEGQLRLLGIVVIPPNMDLVGLNRGTPPNDWFPCLVSL